jgi:hypothetical protein
MADSAKPQETNPYELTRDEIGESLRLDSGNAVELPLSHFSKRAADAT